MSIKLYFERVKGGTVDFPIDTTTKLSYAVFKAKDTETRLKIIKEALMKLGWDSLKCTQMLAKIKSLLNNSSLILRIG